MKERENSIPLFDAAGSRSADASARDRLGVSGFELMQRAASAAVAALLQRYPYVAAVSVWCGKGNNGGDAYLVAADLHRRGLDVQLIALADLDALAGDARLAAEEALAAGLTPQSFGDAALEITGDVVIDGLLGTGVTGEPRPAYAEAIDAINASGRPVFSIDVPSGVDADTGAAAKAVNADLTVTFITQKIGLFTGAGGHLKGELVFADLGTAGVIDRSSPVRLARWHAAALEPVDPAAYKHSRGAVLVIGGDHGMPGAVALSAWAALRAGAGLVTVATRAAHLNAVVGRHPELMFCEADAGGATFASRLSGCEITVLGPGMGRGEFASTLFSTVQDSGKPTVLDADGLFCLAEAGTWTGGPLYLTPHSAEGARLLGTTPAEVEADRPGAAIELANRFSASVVLKGPGSLIAGPGGLTICGHGNPGMASPGMGDVLAGISGGLLAAEHRAGSSGERCHQTFTTGVLLHSAAADRAAETFGDRSLVASDVIDALVECLAQ